MAVRSYIESHTLDGSPAKSPNSTWLQEIVAPMRDERGAPRAFQKSSEDENPIDTPPPCQAKSDTERRSRHGTNRGVQSGSNQVFAEKAVETAFRLKCPTSHPPQSRHRPLRPIQGPRRESGAFFFWGPRGRGAPRAATARGDRRGGRAGAGCGTPRRRRSARRSGPSRCRRSPRHRVPRG